MGIRRSLALSSIDEPLVALNGVEWTGGWNAASVGVAYVISYVFGKVGCSYRIIADVTLLRLFCGLFIGVLTALPKIGVLAALPNIGRGLFCRLFLDA
jgi:hypothetical protein